MDAKASLIWVVLSALKRRIQKKECENHAIPQKTIGACTESSGTDPGFLHIYRIKGEIVHRLR